MQPNKFTLSMCIAALTVATLFPACSDPKPKPLNTYDGQTTITDSGGFVYAEPPTPLNVVTINEQPPISELLLVVHHAPPAVVYEPQPLQPSPVFVWVGGYWVCHKTGWKWVIGRWVIPPTPGAVWLPPRWESKGDTFRFFPGVWR